MIALLHLLMKITCTFILLKNDTLSIKTNVWIDTAIDKSIK